MTTTPNPDLSMPAQAVLIEPADHHGDMQPEEAQLGKKPSRGQLADITRRFRRNKLAMVGLVVVTILVVLAVFEPLIVPFDP